MNDPLERVGHGAQGPWYRSLGSTATGQKVRVSTGQDVLRSRSIHHLLEMVVVFFGPGSLLTNHPDGSPCWYEACYLGGCMPMRPLTTQGSVQIRTGLQPDPLTCLVNNGVGGRVAAYSKNDIIFSQAAPADAVFYIIEGTVLLRVVSSWGREAIVAILGVGDFFGEGCLTGQPFRTSTAAAMTDCSIMRLEKRNAVRLIRDEPGVSELFLRYLLSRNMKMQEDLVDQLFNTSERRLARLLLQLARFDEDDKSEAVIPKINQETLAEIVGTTRSRVSLFMNKFRRLGLVDYIDHSDVLTVRSGLLNVILHDGESRSRDSGGERPGAVENRQQVKQLSA